MIAVRLRWQVHFMDRSHRGRSRYRRERDNLKLYHSVGQCEEKRMRRMIARDKERVLDRGLLLPRVRVHSKHSKDGIVRRELEADAQVDVTLMPLMICLLLLVCRLWPPVFMPVVLTPRARPAHLV